jgi:hypothetical protein
MEGSTEGNSMERQHTANNTVLRGQELQMQILYIQTACSGSRGLIRWLALDIAGAGVMAWHSTLTANTRFNRASILLLTATPYAFPLVAPSLHG